MKTKEERNFDKLKEIQEKATDLIGQYNRLRNLSHSLAHKHLYQEIEEFTNKFKQQ
jgi:hypothetical protein